jgi:hypothetical protein
MMNRSAPLKRTEFKRNPASKANAFAKSERKEASAVAKIRKPMKSSRPKMTKIRSAARGQECTLQIFDVCNCDPETTVLCHDNRIESGKGMGLKAPDSEACFACSSCHDVLDGRTPRPNWLTLDALWRRFDLARMRTHEILRREGLLP